MRSMRTGVVIGAIGIALFCVPGGGTAVAARGAGVRSCGADPASGLGVLAGKRVTCGVARQVAAACTKVWHGARGGAEVRAAGARWTCGERRGNPDPYQACVEVKGSGRVVTLSS